MALVTTYAIPDLPPPQVDLHTPELLLALVAAHRHLAELKGCSASIPNKDILINNLMLQEAKASSEVESFVTTQDELFQADLHIAEAISPAANTAQQTVQLVSGMRELMAETKRRMRADLPKLYSQDLLNNLFRHPYTRIEYVQRDLNITRQTAVRYLRQLVEVGLVQEQCQGKHLYFINQPLVDLLTEGEYVGR